MPTYKVNIETVKSMNPTDKSFLSAIYSHRCLNEELAYQFFYKKVNAIREYTLKRIRWMTNKGLIEPIEYGGEFPALFLTMLGIETYRYICDIPKEAFDFESGKMKKTLKSAYELKMQTGVLRHQMELNRFELMFEARANGAFPIRYEDEKFMRMSMAIRPDGMIQLQDLDLFLEMDMATETSSALLSKWNHYQEYLHTNGVRDAKRKIVVLFILNNVKNPERRRNTVLATIKKGLLDQVNQYFEIHIGTITELMDIVFARYLPTSTEYQHNEAVLQSKVHAMHQYIYAQPSFMESVIPEYRYSAYIRKLNHEKKVLIQDGKMQEFLLFSYIGKPLSTLAMIAFRNRDRGRMIRAYHRPIPYLIIVEDERSFFYDLCLISDFDLQDVFFTTESRLKEKTFPEALFQYEKNGNLFHFKNFSFTVREFETNVKDKKTTRSLDF